MAFAYGDAYFTGECFVFLVLTRWIAQAFLMLNLLYNGPNITKYDAYWLMSFGNVLVIFLLKWLQLCFQISKQARVKK